MLDGGAAAGVPNVLFVEADAYALPFTGGAFDVAMCRFALHHMTEPARAIAEMARVVRDGGRVALIDMVAVDPALAPEHDRLEILRDPSHTRAMAAEEVTGALRAAGAAPREPVFRDQAMEYDRWLGQSKPSVEAAAEVTEAIESEADGTGPATGLRAARTDDGGLTVTQRWMLVVADVRPV
jgi:SAM-dependent methyltransferase